MVAVSYGLARYSYGLFVPDIRADLKLSTGALGLLASGSYVGFLIASSLTTVIAGRIGPRLPVVVGGLSAAAGMILISRAEAVGVLAVGVIIAGSSPGWAYIPFSDAVVRLIPRDEQPRVYAYINSGTGFGVLIAGPIALWAGNAWRTAWLVFAALAFGAAIWNGVILPSAPHQRQATTLPRLRLRWLLKRTSAPLFALALLLGVATSVYWTFAVDLSVTANAGTSGTGVALWTVVGVAGIAGAFAHAVVARLGLARATRGACLAVGAAIALLAAAPSSRVVTVLSAVGYGLASARRSFCFLRARWQALRSSPSSPNNPAWPLRFTLQPPSPWRALFSGPHGTSGCEAPPGRLGALDRSALLQVRWRTVKRAVPTTTSTSAMSPLARLTTFVGEDPSPTKVSSNSLEVSRMSVLPAS